MKPTLFFDGTCVLCNRCVHFIMKNDPHHYFSFAAIQSDSSQEILRQRGIDTGKIDSLILLEKNQIYLESTAVLRVLSRLSLPWKLLGNLIFLPRPFRDSVYRLIARHRYRWWGRMEQCSLPESKD